MRSVGTKGGRTSFGHRVGRRALSLHPSFRVASEAELDWPVAASSVVPTCRIREMAVVVGIVTDDGASKSGSSVFLVS